MLLEVVLKFDLDLYIGLVDKSKITWSRTSCLDEVRIQKIRPLQVSFCHSRNWIVNLREMFLLLYKLALSILIKTWLVPILLQSEGSLWTSWPGLGWCIDIFHLNGIHKKLNWELVSSLGIMMGNTRTIPTLLISYWPPSIQLTHIPGILIQLVLNNWNCIYQTETK